ncbi:hypothetical protein BC332_16269 [Capsicum chinense]|nr:hypothetical protein BC332_16269 [Capsicum chinense]
MILLTLKLATQSNVSGEEVLVKANTRRPGILGMVFGRKSIKTNRLPDDTSTMAATNFDATFDRITDNIKDMKGHVERLRQLVSTLIPTNPKPKVQTPCGESFPKEVATQTCEGLSHRGKDEHTHERQGKITNFYTLVHVNDEHVTNKPLSVSSSLPTYEYIDFLPLVDDVHVVRVDTLVDPIDDRIYSSSKIDLCPPRVEAIVLNEST